MQRLDQSNDTIATSVANVEEAMRGWLASIAREKNIERQVFAYRELAELFEFFAGFTIAVLDTLSAQLFFTGFRRSGIRIGSMDLKTACISIANNALLLSANRKDFEKVPGLRFENWLI